MSKRCFIVMDIRQSQELELALQRRVLSEDKKNPNAMIYIIFCNIEAFEIDSIFCDDEDDDQIAQECGVL